MYKHLCSMYLSLNDLNEACQAYGGSARISDPDRPYAISVYGKYGTYRGMFTRQPSGEIIKGYPSEYGLEPKRYAF